jgi:translation initiation factor 2 subunit 3
MALTISGVEKIVIVQNKIDIVDEAKARENYEQIREFVKGTIAEKSPIIPVSAHHDANIDALIEAIETHIPTPKIEDGKPARMFVARSFDINPPGKKSDELVGGVLGGTLLSGRLKVGDEIEIAPGRRVEDKGKMRLEPVVTEITSLYTGGGQKDEVLPGGLIAIGTLLDPFLTKSDSMIGKVVGRPGTLPAVLSKLSMDVTLLERVVGYTKDMAVDALKSSEPLMLSVGTTNTVGMVTSARGSSADVALKIPVCAEPGQRVAISRKIVGKWRLIGYGILTG